MSFVGLVNTTFRESVQILVYLVKITLPILIVVEVGIQFGLVEFLDRIFQPLMAFVGLPPKIGIVLATTMVTNPYGGFAAFVAVGGHQDLSVAQATVMGTMILLLHGLPVEQRIVQKAGASLIFTTAVRIGIAFVLGAILHHLYSFLGLLQEIVNLAWLPEPLVESVGLQRWKDWMWITLQSFLLMFVIIIGLVFLLKLLDLFGVTKKINASLAPFLKVMGISREAAPLTMIGCLLGLSFGGALLINEAQEGKLDDRSVFLSLLFICLCHSVIEDTLIVMAMGADWTGIFLARIIFSIFFMIPMGLLIHRMSDRTFYRLFFRKP